MIECVCVLCVCICMSIHLDALVIRLYISIKTYLDFRVITYFRCIFSIGCGQGRIGMDTRSLVWVS